MVCFLLKAKAIVDAPEMDIHNTSPPEMVANRKEDDVSAYSFKFALEDSKGSDS